jgi:glucoselysine-6-phosphate deglycase
MVKILDYINETSRICNEIIENRKSIVHPLVSIVKNNKIDEIMLIGSGTSCFAGLTVKPFIEKICKIRVSALFPNIFMEQTPPFLKNVLVIGISQSGSSYSTLKAIKYAKSLGFLTLALTTDENSMIVQESDSFIKLDCGDEKAVAKTKGYQASVVTLWLCGLEWSLTQSLISNSEYNESLEKLKRTVNNLPLIIDESTKWFNLIQDEIILANNLMVIGTADQMGNTMEATLKLIETVRIPVMGFELEEFMHGIYNQITNDTFIIYLASNSYYFGRMLDLRNYIDKKTEHQFIILPKDQFISAKDCYLTNELDSEFSAIENIIPIQIICNFLPLAKGIDPFISGDPNFHKSLKSKLV